MVVMGTKNVVEQPLHGGIKENFGVHTRLICC